jgi:hypothetical protein
MDLAITKVQRDLCVTSELWFKKAERLRGQVQKAQATNQEVYHKQARRERSPSEESTEVVEVGPRENGKQKVGQRESKRAKAEEVETAPDLMEVSPRGCRITSRGRGRTGTTTVPGRTSNTLTTRGWHGETGQGST